MGHRLGIPDSDRIAYKPPAEVPLSHIYSTSDPWLRPEANKFGEGVHGCCWPPAAQGQQPMQLTLVHCAD